MPGKRRFGGAPKEDARKGLIQAAAQRRLGSIAGGKVSGGGLARAANAGPSTSPLASKRLQGIQQATQAAGKQGLVPGKAPGVPSEFLNKTIKANKNT